MTASLLDNFQGNVKLQNAHPSIVRAVQIPLLRVGLYSGKLDGVCGIATSKAFAEFKRLEYLEHPNLLGTSTAKVLLEAVNDHPIPIDSFTSKGMLVIRLPEVGIVSSREPIPGCQYFTWGELTKGLTRVPDTIEIVRNTIKLARYLEQIRRYLGNKVITVISGYRPPYINGAVGGVSNSRHTFGDAADIVVDGVAPYMVFKLLNHWHNDHGGLGNGASFTHIDLRGYAARWNYG